MKTAERAARCLFFFSFFLKRTYPAPLHRFKLPFPAFSPFRGVYYVPHVKLEEKKKVVTSKGFFQRLEKRTLHSRRRFIHFTVKLDYSPVPCEFPPSFLSSPLLRFLFCVYYYSTKEKLVASDRVFDVR